MTIRVIQWTTGHLQMDVSIDWRIPLHPKAPAALFSLAAALLTAAALPAHAQLTPIAQARSADFSWSTDEGTYFCLLPTSCSPIEVTHSQDQGDDQAPDFGPWSASLGGIVSIDSSALGPQGFTASATHAGSGAAALNATGSPGEFYALSTYMTSSASLSYSFSVDEETPYHLAGSIQTSGAGLLGSMLARIRMTGPGGELVNVELVDDDDCFDPACLDLGPEPVDASGVLLPGSYTVEADIQGTGEPLISLSTGVAAANSYEGSFALTLSTGVPLPAAGAPALVLLAAAVVGIGRRILTTGSAAP